MIVNREIKFRFWDTTEKRFINLCRIDENGKVREGNHYYDDVHPQQYTGLKDKDDREIYEGDIISCDEYMGNGMKDYHRPITVVIFDGCSWSYSLDKTRNWKNPHQILRYARNIKVIGNIYQNPELL